MMVVVFHGTAINDSLGFPWKISDKIAYHRFQCLLASCQSVYQNMNSYGDEDDHDFMIHLPNHVDSNGFSLQ